MIRHITRYLLPLLAATGMLAVQSCKTDTGKAVDRMVSELNSPEFKSKELATGLFSDSEATLRGDTLTLTFVCAPAVTLDAFTPDRLPALRQISVAEFKSALANGQMKKGMEALRDNGMTMLMVWTDCNGKTVRLEINPADILD